MGIKGIKREEFKDNESLDLLNESGSNVLLTTIPEKIRTNPTKIAPTRKNNINHSLLIEPDFRIIQSRTKISYYLIIVKCLTAYKGDNYHI